MSGVQILLTLLVQPGTEMKLLTKHAQLIADESTLSMCAVAVSASIREV